MILLTKRDETNPSGEYSLEELVSLFDSKINPLINKIDELELELGKVKKSIPKEIKLNKSTILDELIDDKVIRFKGVNVSNVGSIEKDKSISKGTIYYNEKLNVVRIKTTKGWESLITK